MEAKVRESHDSVSVRVTDSKTTDSIAISIGRNGYRMKGGTKSNDLTTLKKYFAQVDRICARNKLDKEVVKFPKGVKCFSEFVNWVAEQARASADFPELIAKFEKLW
jgi:hypothetical protein